MEDVFNYAQSIEMNMHRTNANVPYYYAIIIFKQNGILQTRKYTSSNWVQLYMKVKLFCELLKQKKDAEICNSV